MSVWVIEPLYQFINQNPFFVPILHFAVPLLKLLFLPQIHKYYLLLTMLLTLIPKDSGVVTIAMQCVESNNIN